MKHLLIFCLLFPVLSYSQSMQPGQWSAQSSFRLNGIPMPPSSSDECLTDEEAKDAKATIEKGLKRNSCSLTSWEIKKKKLKASVACKNANYDAKGDLSGTFDKKKYDLSGKIKGTHKVFGAAWADVTLSGQWVSACEKPKEEKE